MKTAITICVLVVLCFCFAAASRACAAEVPEITLRGHTLEVEALALSSDGKSAASGSRDKTVRLWDLATGKELRRFEGHSDDVRSVAFAPDGKRLVSGSGDRYGARSSPDAPNDCSVRVWDVQTGKHWSCSKGIHLRRAAWHL